MSKSAKGTAEKVGRHVAAKSGLNKAILDPGWFEFRRQLRYKLEWNGGMLVAVPPRFACVDCGYENHADVVGALNVLARGHRVAACGEEGSGLTRTRQTQPASVKQEPTEVTTDENSCVAL